MYGLETSILFNYFNIDNMNMKMHVLISRFFGGKISPYFKEKKVEFVTNINKYYVIRK